MSRCKGTLRGKWNMGYRLSQKPLFPVGVGLRLIRWSLDSLGNIFTQLFYFRFDRTDDGKLGKWFFGSFVFSYECIYF